MLQSDYKFERFNMKKAILELGKLSGIVPLELMENLRKQNKKKEWDITPIQIEVKGSKIVENSKQIKSIVELMDKHTKDVCRNALDIEEVENTKENISTILAWFKGSRIQLTKPLDDMKKNFTSLEKDMGGLINDLKDKEDAIREKDYQIAEKSIRNELAELIDGASVDVSIEVFEDFVENKRKLKGMMPNDKNKLSAASLKSISEQFNLIAQPLMDAKELEAKKTQQSKAFDLYIGGVTLIGSAEHLEANLVSLGQLSQQIDELYPDIKEECHRRIANSKTTIEGNMRASKIEDEKKANQTHDQVLWKQVEALDKESDDVNILKATLDTLREIRLQLIDAQTITNNS